MAILNFAKLVGAVQDRVAKIPSLFDQDYYLKCNPDLQSFNGSLYRHYDSHGWREGRDPHPLFDSTWYSETYLPEGACENPLEHYSRIGWKIGLSPSPIFDVGWFRNTYMAGQVGKEPIAYYMRHFAGELVSPHPLINLKAYLNDNLDASRDALDALSHVLYEGYHAVRAAVPGFDPEHYRSKNPEIADKSDLDAWRHFLAFGKKTHGVFWPTEAVTKARNLTDRHAPKTPEEEAPIIIAGFHRSGTSMTANLLLNSGLYLGDRLLGANYSNPRGHFEDVEVISFHDRLLARAGQDWMVSEPFTPKLTEADIEWMRDYGARHADIGAWGFKDPRSTLFLPQWLSVFPNATVLYIHRPCIECVYSIKRRTHALVRRGINVQSNLRFWTEDDLAVKMYLTYAEAALDFFDQHSGPATVVTLDDILAGYDIVGQIRENWGYDLNESRISDIFESKEMSRVGPNEYIHDARLLDRIESVESRFSKLAKQGFMNSKRTKMKVDQK